MNLVRRCEFTLFSAAVILSVNPSSFATQVLGWKTTEGHHANANINLQYISSTSIAPQVIPHKLHEKTNIKYKTCLFFSLQSRS